MPRVDSIRPFQVHSLKGKDLVLGGSAGVPDVHGLPFLETHNQRHGIERNESKMVFENQGIPIFRGIGSQGRVFLKSNVFEKILLRHCLISNANHASVLQ